jgi:hypothetical protein
VIKVEEIAISCQVVADRTLINKSESLELNGNTGRIESISGQTKADKDFLATGELNNSRDAYSVSGAMK